MTGSKFVFISYSHQDQAYVDALAGAIRADGIEVWFDDRLGTGDPFDRVLQEKVEQCAAMVVVMTPAADRSKYVAAEINWAMSLHKPILPLLLEGRGLFNLGGYNHKDVTDGGPPPDSFYAELRGLAATKLIYVGREDRRLRLKSPGWKVAFSPNGQHLATGSERGLLQTWDARLDMPGKELYAFGEPVYAVAWSPDGRYVAAASTDGRMAVVDCERGRKVAEFKGHRGAIYSVTWRPDSEQLATAGFDKAVRLWNRTGGAETGQLLGHEAGVMCVSWSPKGDRIATASEDGTVRIWHPNRVEILSGVEAHPGAWAMGVTWSPDGTRLASCGTDRLAHVWEAETLEVERTLVGHEHSVWSIAWAPGGTHIATASFDATARVWDAGTGRLVGTLKHGRKALHSVSWRGDGLAIATTGDDKTVGLWRVFDVEGATERLLFDPDRTVVYAVPELPVQSVPPPPTGLTNDSDAVFIQTNARFHILDEKDE